MLIDTYATTSTVRYAEINQLSHEMLNLGLHDFHMGDVGQRVRERVKQTCEAFEIRIIKGVVSKDHVHILVSTLPEMVPSEIMRRIKGRTASKLFEEFPTLKRRYWGLHFWARGYFCATVGEVTEEMIKEYLEHHFEPDPAKDFQVEP